jgi:multiple antibiotic resistance protein
MLLWRGAMNAMFTTVLEFGLLALSSIFFLVDPIAVIPVFLAMTSDMDPERRKSMAKRASLTVFVVLAGFGCVGELIFRAMGLTLPAFKIAGGLVLLQIGRDMLQAKHFSTKSTPAELEEGAVKLDASVVPLGMPLLAGPGAISTVMVLLADSHTWWKHVVVYSAIVVTASVSYFSLVGAARVQRYLGETGMNILSRLMGLLLMALAVQFFVNGLMDLGVVRQVVKVP